MIPTRTEDAALHNWKDGGESGARMCTAPLEALWNSSSCLVRLFFTKLNYDADLSQPKDLHFYREFFVLLSLFFYILYSVVFVNVFFFFLLYLDGSFFLCGL